MRMQPLLLSLAIGAGFFAFSTFEAAAGPDCTRKPDHWSCNGGDNSDDGDAGNNGGQDDYDGPDLDYAEEGYDPQNPPATYHNWMHQDVGLAHFLGHTGALSHLIIVDDHVTDSGISGNLDGKTYDQGHGFFTSLEARLVAPGASHDDVHWNYNGVVTDYFRNKTEHNVALNVINMSYGQYASAGFDPYYFDLGSLSDSIVSEAHAGTAVFVKAAGNTSGGTVDGTARLRLGSPRPVTVQDYLNLQLIGAEGALFVGALDGNGTAEAPASIASYSTIAGGNELVQNMFLVAGVDSGAMGGLAGTSFAAPIVSGYAAIIGDKFETNLSGVANPGALVVDQLLATARKDTILNYSASVHGMGEADLSRALAPKGIPY